MRITIDTKYKIGDYGYFLNTVENKIERRKIVGINIEYRNEPQVYSESDREEPIANIETAHIYYIFKGFKYKMREDYVYNMAELIQSSTKNTIQ